jgi:NAD(P)-dependent dehydrogenase (short-subunit alcohol dehydrogenase family)
MSEKNYPRPPFPVQPQAQTPGRTGPMDPPPDHGEHSYRGTGRLSGKSAVITGGDSGIGRAVALAFAREGADVLIGYLDEHDEARETAMWVEKAGRRAVLVAGDISEPRHCRALIKQGVEAFGKIDILVNNAAYQKTFQALDEITDEAWDRTFATNVGALFRLAQAAVPHMPEGSAIINTASINADKPNPILPAYAASKAAIQNLSGSLAQMLAPQGIRVNCVAPGPIWTPLIPSTMPPDAIKSFGTEVPMKRPGQPVEVAPVYVMLASDEASYVSGATVAVTGGLPMI